MSDFKERYFAAEKELAKELDEQVKLGQKSREDADFEFYMRRDEILYFMGMAEEEDYNVEDE